MITEHVVKDHLKVVYVCEESNSCEAFGDLVPVKSCFQPVSCLEVGGARSCLTDWFDVEGGLRVRLTLAEVDGECRVISFQAAGVRQGLSADKLVESIERFVQGICGSA